MIFYCAQRDDQESGTTGKTWQLRSSGGLSRWRDVPQASPLEGEHMKGKITTLIVGLVLGSTSVKRRQKITIENRRELHNLSGRRIRG